MPISRWQIVDRGQTLWGPPRSVVYVMGGTGSPTGHRPDCSGYVSMCLDLPTPGLDTVTLVTAGKLAPISWDQVQPGDLIGICGPGTGGANGHVTMVETVDGDRYTVLEQTPPRGFQRNTYTRNTLQDNGFAPYKYTNLEEDNMTTPADVWGFPIANPNGGQAPAATFVAYSDYYAWLAGTWAWQVKHLLLGMIAMDDPITVPPLPAQFGDFPETRGFTVTNAQAAAILAADDGATGGGIPPHTHDVVEHVTGGVTQP